MKKYHTAAAFRAALEDNLKTHSRKIGSDLQRLQRRVAFDCPKCHSYRITKKFMNFNNAQLNPAHWKAWTHYLQNRLQEKEKKRVLISTFLHVPNQTLIVGGTEQETRL